MAYDNAKLKGYKFLNWFITSLENIEAYVSEIRNSDARIAEQRLDAEKGKTSAARAELYKTNAVAYQHESTRVKLLRDLDESWKLRTSDAFRAMNPKQRREVTDRVNQIIAELMDQEPLIKNAPAPVATMPEV